MNDPKVDFAANVASTTCQICAREIKSANGLIAHHGYQRPGYGYQTRSCFGARWKPYECGHDAIDAYLPKLEQWLGDARVSVSALLADPPGSMTYERRDAYHKVVVGPIDLMKPEGFDPAKTLRLGAYRPQSYELLYCNRVREIERNIKGLESDIEFLRGRLAEWKNPEVAA